MIVSIGGIPVYDAVILDSESGMMRISLVDDPAVMSNFQAFANKPRAMMYAVQDEEKRLVRGVIMRADFPIYRYSREMGEYYIIYKADQIRIMAEKYLLESRQNNVNLMHEDGSDVEGVQMVQYFIKGEGVSVEGFEDIADGSLFAEFHVVNDEVWEAIKDGTYKGFSLEGFFELQPEENEEEVRSIVDVLDGAFRRLFQKSNTNQMTKLSRFKTALAKMLQEFANVTTDKGVLGWDGDEELKVGDQVFIEDEEGNRTLAEDGDYTTEDGQIFVVAGGVVTEIKEATAIAEVPTNNGTLICEGDLSVGVEVFVENAEGERVPAGDGEYTAEDGRVIVVAEGKVSEIREAEKVVETESKFRRIVLAFAESYEEKVRKIYDALRAILGEVDFYIVEAADEYVVVNTWSEEEGEKYFRYDLAWDEEGNVTASNPTEVVPAFVEKGKKPEDSEEVEALRVENESLKAKVAELEKMSAAKSAHNAFRRLGEVGATGDKGLDNLTRIARAK